MKYRCYPLRRHFRPWEYLLPLGLVAGPGAVVLALDYSNGKPAVIIPLLFLVMFPLCHYGWAGLRTLMEGYLPLHWDDQEVRWLFRKYRWCDLKTITLLNLSTRQGRYGLLLRFDRLLVFKDADNQELLRLPFQHRDHVTRKLVPPEDSLWLEFIRTLERHFSLVPGSLTKELSSYANEERLAASVRWPDPSPGLTLFTIITGALAVLILSLEFMPIWLWIPEAIAVVGAVIFFCTAKRSIG